MHLLQSQRSDMVSMNYFKLSLAFSLFLVPSYQAQSITTPNVTVLSLPGLSRAQKELHQLAIPRPDLLCNLDSDYQCICDSSLGDLKDEYMECNVFLQVESLDIVRLHLKNANMSLKLYTNEPFEEYFKRRVTTILSTYCEHKANNCTGIQLKITKVDQNGENSLNNEPLITQKQLIILGVRYLPDKITQIDMVVSTIPTTGSINGQFLMNPTLIKYILSAQIAPLSRVLGGIKVEAVTIDKIKRFKNESLALPYKSSSISPIDGSQEAVSDNSAFHKIIGITCIFFLIVYTIAIYKVVKGCCDKKKITKRTEHQQQSVEVGLAGSRNNSIKNYGTVPKKDEKATVPLREITYEKGMVTPSNINPGISTWNNGDEDIIINPITPHSFKRMFMCDTSQLPRELTIDLDTTTSTDGKDINIGFSKPVMVVDEVNEMDEAKDKFNENEPLSHYDNVHTDDEENVGTVDEVTDFIVDSESVVDEELILDRSGGVSSGLLGFGTACIDRPLSRRCSRESPISLSQDHEETMSSREGTPAPIMEDPEYLPMKPIIQEEDETPVVVKSKPRMIPVLSITVDDDADEVMLDEFDDHIDPFETKESHDDVWSSEDEEDKQAYQIMSEENLNNHSEISDEEEDSANYQRLQESPVHYTKSFDLPIDPSDFNVYEEDDLESLR